MCPRCRSDKVTTWHAMDPKLIENKCLNCGKLWRELDLRRNDFGARVTSERPLGTS